MTDIDTSDWVEFPWDGEQKGWIVPHRLVHLGARIMMGEKLSRAEELEAIEMITLAKKVRDNAVHTY